MAMFTTRHAVRSVTLRTTDLLSKRWNRHFEVFWNRPVLLLIRWVTEISATTRKPTNGKSVLDWIRRDNNILTCTRVRRSERLWMICTLRLVA